MSKIENIKNALGKPDYENEFGLIYNQDCQEGLKKLMNSGVELDITITSPPYNIGKEYEKIMPLNEYIEWLVDICDNIYKLTKKDGSFLLNVGYLSVEGKGKAVPITYLLWEKIKFFLQQEIVWNYGAGVAGKKFLSPRNEKVLWYIKDSENYTFNLDDIRDPDVKYPNQKKNGKLRCNTLGKNPSDVWQIAKVTSGTDRSSDERTNHPAQFPEDLIVRMVKGFSNENDLILDPFIGSGTTARTAMLNNRLFLGFEINKNYIEIIGERLNQTLNEIDIRKKTLTLF
jgi:adenine-specific DNA-methyltransferase